MINILQSKPARRAATDRGSEEEKINEESFLFFPPYNIKSETQIRKPQRKIQVTTPLLVHSAVGGALVSTVSSSSFFFLFFLTRRGGVSEELAHIQRKLTPTSALELRQGQTTEPLTNTPGAQKKQKKRKRNWVSLWRLGFGFWRGCRTDSQRCSEAACALWESTTSRVCSAVASHVKAGKSHCILCPERMLHFFLSIIRKILYFFKSGSLGCQQPTLSIIKKYCNLDCRTGVYGNFWNDDPSWHVIFANQVAVKLLLGTVNNYDI